MDEAGGNRSKDSMSPAKLRCVVIDDDQEFLVRVQRWFVTSCTDFEVLPFSNGIDAVEFLRQKRVDLIFTGYLMPQIDGLQLISAIRAFNPQVPIFMASGVPIEKTALARGATGFLRKGALWSQLAAILAKLRERMAPLAA
jgi:putative two-component system response regulator